MSSEFSDCSVYDHMLMEVLQGEGQISPFLDVIFSFLYRRTDFYKILHKKSENMGFPPGYAETLVREAFSRYHELAMQDEELYKRNKLMENSAGNIPPVLSTVEINDDTSKERASKLKLNRKSRTTHNALTESSQKQFQDSNESYNGAQREQFSWSQNRTDVDVHIWVPEHITSANSVKVNLTSNHLTVSFQESSTGSWKEIINDDLLHSVASEEAVWNLFPREHIFISLEKIENRWWNSLLKNEPKIDVNQIDNSQPYEELDEESRTKIDQLIFDERQLATGQPTSQQLKLESTLKQAWDVEGSPFKDQPFDSTLVANLNLNPSASNSES